jgi:hypothetical protein
MSMPNFKLLILILCLFFNLCFVNSKTNDILNSEKLENKRSEVIEDLDLIKKRIFENLENSLVVFYADWCPHW